MPTSRRKNLLTSGALVTAALLSGCSSVGETANEGSAGTPTKTINKTNRENLAIKSTPCFRILTDTFSADLTGDKHSTASGIEILSMGPNPEYVAIYRGVLSLSEVRSALQELELSQALYGHRIPGEYYSDALAAGFDEISDSCFRLEGAYQQWPLTAPEMSDCGYVVLEAVESYIHDRLIEGGTGDSARVALEADWGAASKEVTAFDDIKNHPEIWAVTPSTRGLYAAQDWAEHACGQGGIPTPLSNPDTEPLPPWVEGSELSTIPSSPPRKHTPAPSPADTSSEFPTNLPSHVDTCEEIASHFYPFLEATGDYGRVMREHFSGSAWGSLEPALQHVARGAQQGAERDESIGEACADFDHGWHPPLPGSPQDSEVSPHPGGFPTEIPTEIKTCQDLVVYFSPDLATGTMDTVEMIMSEFFPELLGTTEGGSLAGSLRSALGDPALTSNPRSVADYSCTVAPSS